MLAAGFPTMPIELSATRLSEKSRQANHIFKLSEVKDLVKEINNPIAIFRYGNNAKNVIVGIEHNGKYCCPVNFKTALKTFQKPFRVGLRAFFFKKQAP